MDKSEIEPWTTALQELHKRIGQWFKRGEVRQRAYDYMQGLLSNIRRKNGWQLAEQAGERRPDGMQRLIATAVWDEDGVRDEVRSYVKQQLGAVDGVLIVDETGFLKKGKASVGVKRQYSGTAGGIENCQLGVFLAYSSPKGHALIDRALYLPKEWLDDKQRREQAKIPMQQRFAKKATLGRQMLERAIEAQVPHQWVLGDCVYGDDRELREWLQERHEWYVLGITCNHLLYYEGARQRFDEIAASLPSSAWQQLSCGSGTKGERLYDWAMVSWHNVDYPDEVLHAFLVRRNPLDPTDEAYFRVFAPAGTSLPVLARAAGQRWAIEECFELAKDELGLDHYETRSWHGWLRHTTLVMLTLAFLAVIRYRELHREQKNAELSSPAMVSLSIPEIRHLLQAVTLLYTAALEHVMAWSQWRRIHQARAMVAHIRRQQAFLHKMRAFP
jgi:SRSO17 transposase